MKRLMLAVILVAVTGSSIAVLLTPNQAMALSGADFKAGRIIDDGVFYNANTMNVDQIQRFLNAKVPNCDTNGSQSSGRWNDGARRYYSRAEWGALKGNSAPFVCLRDYREDVASINADSYCRRIDGGASMTAADMIDRVSKACNINPQVMLVLLQKEQGLITDEWPWQGQYNAATGFACPDTAPCDAAYKGFFSQVYRAARQYQIYTRLSSSFNYKSNRTNYVLYNPNANCGGSNVFIENQATANLYNFTPYQPNGAALRTLQGTGDDCSAYGNRNFWVYFSNWFGNPLQSNALADQASAQKRIETVDTDYESYNFYYDAYQQVLRLSVRNLSTGAWSHDIFDGSSLGGNGRIDGNIGSSVTATRYGNYVQVFYYDKTNGNLRHAWTDANGWHYENLDGDRGSAAKYTGDVGINPSVAVLNGQLQLFYYDSGNGNLRHAWTDARGWNFENLDGDRGSIGGADIDTGLSSAVMEYNGQLQLYYYDSGNGNLRHAWTDARGWNFENLDGDTQAVSRAAGNTGMSPTVTKLGTSIQLYYYDSGNGNLRHAWTDARGWNFENLDGDRGSIARLQTTTGINPTVLNYNGQLQLFYYDSGNGNLRHAWTDARGWNFENLDGDRGSIGGEEGIIGINSKAILSGGQINVYYYSQSSGNLKRSRADTTGWRFENLFQSVVY